MCYAILRVIDLNQSVNYYTVRDEVNLSSMVEEQKKLSTLRKIEVYFLHETHQLVTEWKVQDEKVNEVPVPAGQQESSQGTAQLGSTEGDTLPPRSE